MTKENIFGIMSVLQRLRNLGKLVVLGVDELPSITIMLDFRLMRAVLQKRCVAKSTTDYGPASGDMIACRLLSVPSTFTRLISSICRVSIGRELLVA